MSQMRSRNRYVRPFRLSRRRFLQLGAAGLAAELIRVPGCNPAPEPADVSVARESLLSDPVWERAKPCFTFNDNRLWINTCMVELAVESAAVVFVRDRSSGEVLVNTTAWTNRPSVSAGFMPDQSAQATFRQVDASHGQLAYSIGSGQLVVDINVDASGEILLQLTGTGPNITAIDIPIMNIDQSAVILGSGAKYTRHDAAVTDHATHLAFESPIMAVIEGSQAVIGVWSETTVFAPENIELRHTTAYDHLILQTGKDDKQTDPQTLISSPWRIGVYKTWNQAARRWRVRFEERTGARPLWNNAASWVRNVHATYWGRENYERTSSLIKYLKDPTKMDISPEKVLYFLWNGDGIVLFGDHTLANVIGRPTPDIVSLLNSHRMPMVLYHPWTLIATEARTATDLANFSARGWLPSGYVFKPDYEGAPEDWQDYWAEVKTNYYSGSQNYVLHPGSNRFKNYLLRNLSNYCAAHGAQGAYLDILGMDHGWMFPDSRKVIDGQDYALGEVATISSFVTRYPDLAIMSEYLPQRLMPTVFYTWQGAETHLKWNSLVKVNHPLRVALTGSYCWTRESNRANTDDALSALLGGLPEISLVGDYQVTDSRAIWSQQRAKLFTDMELFYDVPEVWDPDALAYYRSKTGNWFKYKIVGSTYAYVEELPDGQDVVRLAQGGVYIPVGPASAQLP